MSRVLNGTNQITNPYGNGHHGIDLVKQTNQLSEIIAHSAGVVTYVQSGHKNTPGAVGSASYGNLVKIKHSNGMYTLYAHLSSVKANTGMTVKQGQVIGYMGDSGNAYGAHLHFEVRNISDERIDPTRYINADLPGNSSDTTIASRLWLHKGAKGRVTAYTLSVAKGTVKYRAGVLNGGWLPYVSKSDINDFQAGYAGCGELIDRISIEFYSGSMRPYRQAEYRVKTEKSGWLPWQVDEKVSDSMDGYAGNIGEPIIDIEVRIYDVY